MVARRYVLTGSSSGIGAATAARLRAAGHEVTGVDQQAGAVSQDIIADLATPAGRRRALDQLLGRLDGRLDALVVCAGVGQPGPDCASVNYFATVELVH